MRYVSFAFPYTADLSLLLFKCACKIIARMSLMVLFQKMDTAGAKVLETAEDIQERRQQVLDRYRRFKELSMVRRQKLEDSYRFQFFRRDADELEKWIQEKLQIASDENYKDPSNLQVCQLFNVYVFKPC